MSDDASTSIASVPGGCGPNVVVPGFGGGKLTYREALRRRRKKRRTVETYKRGPHKFASTQFNLADAVDNLRPNGHQLSSDICRSTNMFDDEDLAKDGRELEPHVTILYGLHSDDPAEVRRCLAGSKPIKLTLGRTSIFPAKEGADYDVVKIDVDSADLHRLNAEVAKCQHTNNHGSYKPHVTLAYVKAGEGKQFAGKSLQNVTGQTVTLDRVVFSDRQGKRTEIKLGDDVERYAADNWSGPMRGNRGGTYWVSKRTGEKVYHDPRSAAGQAKQTAKAVGSAISHVEHSATHAVASAVAKLPAPVQKLVTAAYQASMAGYNAGRTAAEKAAIANGKSPGAAAQIGKTLGMIDLLASKGVFAAAMGAGLGAGAASAAAFVVPAASVGYLAFSTAKNPQATLELARAAIRKVRSVARFERAGYVHIDKIGDMASAADAHDFWLACFAAAMDETKGNWVEAMTMASHATAQLDRARQPETYARRLALLASANRREVERYAFQFQGPRSKQTRTVATRGDIPKTVLQSGAYQEIKTDREKASHDSRVYKDVKRRHSRVQTKEHAEKVYNRLQTLQFEHLRVLGWHHNLKGRSRAELTEKLRAMALLKVTEKMALKPEAEPAEPTSQPSKAETPKEAAGQPRPSVDPSNGSSRMIGMRKDAERRTIADALKAKAAESSSPDKKAAQAATAKAKRAEISAQRKAMNQQRLTNLEALKAKMRAAKQKIKDAKTPTAADRAEKAADRVGDSMAQELAKTLTAKATVKEPLSVQPAPVVKESLTTPAAPPPSKLPGLKAAVGAAQRPQPAQANVGTIKDALRAIAGRKNAAAGFDPHFESEDSNKVKKPLHEHSLAEFGRPHLNMNGRWSVRGPSLGTFQREHGLVKALPSKEAAERWLKKTHERLVKEAAKAARGPSQPATKPVAAAPAPLAVPEPKAVAPSAGTTPTARPLRRSIESAYQKLSHFKGMEDGIVELPRMYHSVKQEHPNLTPEQFHAELKSIAGENKGRLMIQNEAHLAKEPHLGIKTDRGFMNLFHWPDAYANRGDFDSDIPNGGFSPAPAPPSPAPTVPPTAPPQPSAVPSVTVHPDSTPDWPQHSRPHIDAAIAVLSREGVGGDEARNAIRVLHKQRILQGNVMRMSPQQALDTAKTNLAVIDGGANAAAEKSKTVWGSPSLPESRMTRVNEPLSIPGMAGKTYHHTYKGYKVVDLGQDDHRILDANNKIVGAAQSPRGAAIEIDRMTSPQGRTFAEAIRLRAKANPPVAPGYVPEKWAPHPRYEQIEPVTRPMPSGFGDALGWQGVLKDRFAGQDMDHLFVEAVPGGKLSKTLEGYGGYYDSGRRIHVLPKQFSPQAMKAIMDLNPAEHDLGTNAETARDIAGHEFEGRHFHDRIARKGEDVLVKTQYGGNLAKKVKALGGSWDGTAKRWRLPREKEGEVVSYLRDNPHHYTRQGRVETYADRLRSMARR